MHVFKSGTVPVANFGSEFSSNCSKEESLISLNIDRITKQNKLGKVVPGWLSRACDS